MRGKNILWLSLVAMLLSVMMVNIGISAPPPAVPEISMSPTGRLPGPGALGHPGELYPISIGIADVDDLWAAQFTVQYAPFVAVMSAQDFTEGTFMSDSGSHDTVMNVVSDTFNGRVTFIIMRVGPAPRVGASGSGLLATFNLLVVESGESPIELVDSILLDSDGNPISHTRTGDAYYYGTTARLVRTNLPDGRKIKVGNVFTIASKVKNEGDINLTVTVRYDIKRLVNARNIEIRAGQTYGGGGLGEPLPFQYVYADGYIGGYESGDWTNPGALVGMPDGVYSESTVAGSTTGFYTFEDITLSGREIQNIDLRGWTAQPDGTANDFDPYIFMYDNSGGWQGWAWCDSLGGSPVWAWTGGRYYEGGPYDMPEYYSTYMHTEEGFNNMEMFIDNYGASGPRMQIDALRWKVEFAAITPVVAPEYTVMPGQELELGAVTWPTTADHVGSYELTATIEYTSEGFHTNDMGSTQKTLSFWIVP